MMEFIVHNEVYRSWEQMHRRGHSTALFYTWVLLDAEGGKSLANPVEGSLVVRLLFGRNLESSKLCSDLASITNLQLV
jgi:hypothetical protein